MNDSELLYRELAMTLDALNSLYERYIGKINSFSVVSPEVAELQAKADGLKAQLAERISHAD